MGLFSDLFSSTNTELKIGDRKLNIEGKKDILLIKMEIFILYQ